MFSKNIKKQKLNLSEAAPEEVKVDADRAAATIQRFYKKHRPLLPSQETKQSTDYGVMLLGNDPDISGLEKYSKTNEPVALIATGGLRSIYIACQLGNDSHLPKIILIDNSSCVIEFWKKIRSFFKREESMSAFLDNIKKLIIENHSVFQIQKKIDTQGMTQADYKLAYKQKLYKTSMDAHDYLNVLFSMYGFSYIRDIVLNMLIINQSVEDSNTFIKLKKIFDISKIKNVYVYFSNIIPYTRLSSNRDNMIRNLELLNPSLSIHTDLRLHEDKTGFEARHVYFFEKQSAREIKEKLIDIKTAFQSLFEDSRWEYNEKDNMAYITHSDIDKLKKYASILNNLGFKCDLNQKKSQLYALYVIDASKIRDCDHTIAPNSGQFESANEQLLKR